MRYVIKRETTGKVGRCEHDHRVNILQDFDSFDEALAVMKARRQELEGERFNVRTFGPDNDYYVAFNSKELDCIERYWIVAEKQEPEIYWWLM